MDAELAALAVTAGGLPRAELRARLAALRAKFGGSGGGGALESVKGPGRIEPGRSASAAEAAPRPADDTPTPADLAETKVVLLTGEIRALAQALGGKPTALNNWVGTHVEYVPYLGQMQNSLSVLMSGRGNAFDQATLLVALLRSVGIPARYVSADVAVTREDVRDWLGVKDESVALGLLSTGLLPLFTQLGPGNRVVAGHVWVEAYLETSSGVILSTIHVSGERPRARFYDCTGERRRVRTEWKLPWMNTASERLDGTREQDLPIHGGVIEFDLPAWKIFTIAGTVRAGEQA